MKEENKIILYQDDNEITRVSVRFAEEDLWLTQGQLVEIYQTSKSNISEHIKHILEDGELGEISVVRNFRTTASDGKQYMVAHYNLDMIIALGYRIQSQVATIQNKLHYAVHENTAAEVIYNRVDSEKPFVGMTNFKGNYITKDDVKIAKNYLSEIELQRLNLLVSGFLDFAEFQALEMNPMTMKDWIDALDNQIIAHKRKVLMGNGNISHKQAIEKAEKEFEIYRKREIELMESDFDKLLKNYKTINS
ncbi:MAG: virulence RhuM family protein [Paludibacteraceae bacterium]|nr:virulence RhuM family protein [Paludibacteraceae bacterium]